MEIKKSLFIHAFWITLVLFLSILLISSYFADERESFITKEIDTMYGQFNEMQQFLLMSEIYGNEMACLTSEKKLRELDKTIWTLGEKIDDYQKATEEFIEDPFYKEQKRIYNENSFFYLLLLTKLKKECGLNQATITYFYINSKDCQKCDSQSFVLADIHNEIKEEVSIFNFDTELDIKSIDLLLEYYGVDSYPCIVINEKTFCNLQDKQEIIDKICDSTNITYCNQAQ